MNKKSLKPLAGRRAGKASERAFRKELEIDVLARTLYGEARGEGKIGMEAVAAVVMNRVRAAHEMAGYWWGNDIIGVCHKPYQFSCWNKKDPNFDLIQNVDEGDLHFVTALRIARRAVHGTLPDPTGGADHYHARGVRPYWAKKEKSCAEIGSHIFYKLVE